MHLLWYCKRRKKNLFFYIFVTFPDIHMSFFNFSLILVETSKSTINNLIWATQHLQHCYLKIDFRVIIQVSSSRSRN